MKKNHFITFSIVIVAMTIMLSSCEEPFEKKVDKLIASTIETTLYYPESYDPVTTEIDSAFTPYDNPKYIDNMLKVYGLIEKMNMYIEEMNDAQSEVALWMDSYTTYGVSQYKMAVEKFNVAHKKGTQLAEEIMEIGKEVTELEEKEPQFIGYNVEHRYRAQNNAGNVLMDDVLLVINADATEVIATYTNEDFKKIEAAIEYLKK